MSIVVRWSRYWQNPSVHPCDFYEILDTFRHFSRVVTLPSCSSSGIHCFLSIVSLPLTFAVSFTSWVIHSCKVMRNYQSLKSGFASLYLFFIRSKTNAASAQDQSLRYVLQAGLALDGSGCLSQLVQFNIAKFVNCATRLFAELDGFFLLSPNLQQLIWKGIHFVIFHHFLNLTHSSLIFQDHILCNSFNSEVDFKFRLFFLNRWLSTPHQFPDARWFWVVCWGTLVLFSHQFPDARSSTFVSAAAIARHLLSTIFGAGRGVESQIKFFSFEKSLCRCNLSAQSCVQLWHRIWFARTVDLCLVFGQKCSSRRRLDEVSTFCDGVLFLGLKRSSPGCSSSGLFPTGLRGVKKMVCLPSLLSRPPAMSPDLRICTS